MLTVLALAVLGLGAAAAAAPTPSPTPPAKAGVPPNPNAVTFGLGPANAKGADGRSSLNYILDPGSRLSDHVIVHNFSDNTTLVLLVYAADASTEASGAIGYDARANPGTDSSRWITFTNGARVVQLTLKPRQAAVLPVSVAVSLKASPGDHQAAVFVALTAQAVGNGKVPQKLNLEQRVGLVAHFRVSGTIVPQLTIDHLKASYHANWNPIGKGGASLSYRVHNSGNVTLGGPQSVNISGLFGATGSHVAIANVPPLLPGGSATVHVNVKHVSPEFVMSAKVTVTPSGLPSTVNPGLKIENASASFWAVPWLLLVIIGLILGLTVWGVIRSRGPRRRYSGERRIAPTPELAGKL